MAMGGSGHSSDLLSRLKELECPDATFGNPTLPVVAARAKGNWIWDADGRQFLDLCCGFGALPLGHQHDSLREVMARSDHLFQGFGDVLPSVSKVELLEELHVLFHPHFTRFGLALSGGQAVEFALKTAVLKTGRGGFIVFSNGYHGLDLGLLDITDRLTFRTPFEPWLGNHGQRHVVRLPLHADEEALEQARRQLAEVGGVAGVLIEPIQGRGGLHVAELSWLQTLRNFCDTTGALLIYDEILVGLGRAGPWTFAELVPSDLSCFGKAVGGGFPLSVCAGASGVMEAWPESTGEAIHTGTFFGHAFGAAVAASTIKALRQGHFLERVQRVGQSLRGQLEDALRDEPLFVGVQGTGLMLGVAFREPEAGVRVSARLLEEGVLAIPSGAHGQLVSLTPSYTLDADEVDFAVKAFQRAVRSIE